MTTEDFLTKIFKKRRFIYIFSIKIIGLNNNFVYKFEC